MLNNKISLLIFLRLPIQRFKFCKYCDHNEQTFMQSGYEAWDNNNQHSNSYVNSRETIVF